MEISDYLRIIKRRLWILVLVPVLAAGAVAALVLTQPTTYVATATVAAPALVGGSSANQYSGSNGTKAFVSAFAATATIEQVVDVVAKDSGVGSDAIVAGTTVTGVGDSSVIHVREELKGKKAEVAGVAQGLASETIRYLFQTQVDLAEKNEAQAQDTLTKAETALQDFQRKNAVVNVTDTYSQQQQYIFSLQQQMLNLQANGNTSGAAVVQAQISAAKARLATLQPLVSQYQTLTDRKTQALSQFQVTSQASDQARAQYSAADPDAVVSVGTTKKVSILSSLAKKAVPAAAGGLFLAICIVALLEVAGRKPEPADGPKGSVRQRVPSDV